MIDRVFIDSVFNKNNFFEEVIDVYWENILWLGGVMVMINYYWVNFGFNKLIGFDGVKFLFIEIFVLMIWGENDIVLDIWLIEGIDMFVRNLMLCYLLGVFYWV